VRLAAGSREIGYALADPDRPGQWQGLYSSSVPAARALGPTVLVGVVLTWAGPGWLVLAALLALAGPALGAPGTSRRTTSASDQPAPTQSRPMSTAREAGTQVRDGRITAIRVTFDPRDMLEGLRDRAGG
jgi:hypothetical protein